MNQQDQLNLKLALEKKIRYKLTSLFSRIVQENKIHITDNGLGYPSIFFQPELKNILTNHYNQVANSFKGVAFGEDILNLDQLSPWIDDTTRNRTEIIITNTDRQIAFYLNRVRQQAAMAGLALTNGEAAANTSVLLKKRFKKRAEKISITETQTPAEKTKNAEANKAKEQEKIKMQKQWISQKDERVRDGHIEDGERFRANGSPTIVDINSPFIVQAKIKGGVINVEMQHPGDSFYGIPLSAIINCRCHANYRTL